MSAISFREQSIMVFYIQVYLKEKFPNALYYDRDTGKTEKLNTRRLRVTGTYDYVTYQVLSCFMNSQFPNEHFPKKATWETRIDEHGNEYEVLVMKDMEPGDYVKDVINNCIQVSMEGHPEALTIPERVQSYFLKEVVTPHSEQDEIFRVQKLLYSKIPDEITGKFYDEFTQYISEIQQAFIDRYTEVKKDESGNETYVINLPDRYKDFKVTGYCDPWTEVLIDESYQ